MLDMHLSQTSYLRINIHLQMNCTNVDVLSKPLGLSQIIHGVHFMKKFLSIATILSLLATTPSFALPTLITYPVATGSGVLTSALIAAAGGSQYGNDAQVTEIVVQKNALTAGAIIVFAESAGYFMGHYVPSSSVMMQYLTSFLATTCISILLTGLNKNSNDNRGPIQSMGVAFGVFMTGLASIAFQPINYVSNVLGKAAQFVANGIAGIYHGVAGSVIGGYEFGVAVFSGIITRITNGGQAILGYVTTFFDGVRNFVMQAFNANARESSNGSSEGRFSTVYDAAKKD